MSSIANTNASAQTQAILPALDRSLSTSKNPQLLQSARQNVLPSPTSKGSSMLDIRKLKQFQDSENTKISESYDRFPDRTRKLLRALFSPQPVCPEKLPPVRKSQINSTISSKPTSCQSPEEAALYEKFAFFAGGANAFDRPKKMKDGSSLAKFGIEGKDPVTSHLRECLEFCKYAGLVPVVSDEDDKKGQLSMKTDVVSAEYKLFVEFFNLCTQGEEKTRALNFEEFKTFLHMFLDSGPSALEAKIQKTLQDRYIVLKKVAKCLPSTDDPVKDIREYFARIFDTIYDAFAFFDNDGSWQILSATFLHLCKNSLYIPLTNADLKIALATVGWQQSMTAHRFLFAFTWHPVVEKPQLVVDVKPVPAEEIGLYKAFLNCCGSHVQYQNPKLKAKEAAQLDLNERGVEAVQNNHITFHGYVRFLQFVGIIPTCAITQSITGETITKPDVGSLEYMTAVQSYRQSVEREDLMEWTEFKECLFNTIRGGVRNLKHIAHVAKNALYAMRMKMSNFAPSVSNPFMSLKLALRSRFESVFDAFVFFDIDGSWIVSCSEFKSMIKALGLNLTSNDVDLALREICGLNSTTFVALEFCLKLNWADFAAKETQHFDISEMEADLYETFCHFCRAKDSFAKQSHSQQLTETNASGTRGNLLGLPAFLEFCKFADLMPVEVDHMGVGSERTKVNRHSNQYAIALKVFNAVNWANEKDHEISWPEFKEVIFQYFKTGPAIAREILQETEEELQTKYAQFCDNIVSVADPVIALKNTLSTRFNNVFDAFAYMDLNGDWEVSANEMTLAFNDLQLGLTRADLFAVIRRIMKRRSVDAALVISPHEFVKALAWHPRPSQGGIQNALEEAKLRREATAEVAERISQENPYPKPKPSFQRFRAEDAEEYKRLEGLVDELKRFINELEKTLAFRNIPLEILAMPPEEKEQREQKSRQRIRERAAQTSEKTTLQLLEESKSRRPMIVANAVKRMKEARDSPQRYVGEPPVVETLLMYANKRDKEALLRQVAKVQKTDAAVKKLSLIHSVLGVKVKDLPMSAKESFARAQIVAINREVRKKAVLGEVKLAGQVIDAAKRNRAAIIERALQRVEALRRSRAVSNDRDFTPANETIFSWFQRRAEHIVAVRHRRRQPAVDVTRRRGQNKEINKADQNLPRTVEDDNGKEGIVHSELPYAADENKNMPDMLLAEARGDHVGEEMHSHSIVTIPVQGEQDRAETNNTAEEEADAPEANDDVSDTWEHFAGSTIQIAHRPHDNAKTGRPPRAGCMLTPPLPLEPPQPKDVVRFVRKRDLHKLLAAYADIHQMRLAAAHLTEARDAGICGMSFQVLASAAAEAAASRSGLLGTTLASTDGRLAAVAAGAVIQRHCRKAVCSRRYRAMLGLDPAT